MAQNWGHNSDGATQVKVSTSDEALAGDGTGDTPDYCRWSDGSNRTSLYVMRRHSDMRQTYGEAPVAIEAASTYFRKQMRAVERALETNPSYILGERFTAADIMLSTCVTWAAHYASALRTQSSPTIARHGTPFLRPCGTDEWRAIDPVRKEPVRLLFARPGQRSS